MEDDERMDMKRLEECIEKLKEEQRKCIQLFYYEGFGYKQICERLGLEERKVKSYIQNGKRNLEDMLWRKVMERLKSKVQVIARCSASSQVVNDLGFLKWNKNPARLQDK